MKPERPTNKEDPHNPAREHSSRRGLNRVSQSHTKEPNRSIHIENTSTKTRTVSMLKQPRGAHQARPKKNTETGGKGQARKERGDTLRRGSRGRRRKRA